VRAGGRRAHNLWTPWTDVAASRPVSASRQQAVRFVDGRGARVSSPSSSSASSRGRLHVESATPERPARKAMWGDMPPWALDDPPKSSGTPPQAAQRQNQRQRDQQAQREVQGDGRRGGGSLDHRPKAREGVSVRKASEQAEWDRRRVEDTPSAISTSQPRPSSRPVSEDAWASSAVVFPTASARSKANNPVGLREATRADGWVGQREEVTAWSLSAPNDRPLSAASSSSSVRSERLAQRQAAWARRRSRSQQSEERVRVVAVEPHDDGRGSLTPTDDEDDRAEQQRGGGGRHAQPLIDPRDLGPSHGWEAPSPSLSTAAPSRPSTAKTTSKRINPITGPWEAMN